MGEVAGGGEDRLIKLSGRLGSLKDLGIIGIALSVYTSVLGYAYNAGFSEQFNLSPKEVGYSSSDALLRAGTLLLLLWGILAVFALIALVTVRGSRMTVIEVSRWLGPVLLTVGLTLIVASAFVGAQTRNGWATTLLFVGGIGFSAPALRIALTKADARGSEHTDAQSIDDRRLQSSVRRDSDNDYNSSHNRWENPQATSQPGAGVLGPTNLNRKAKNSGAMKLVASVVGTAVIGAILFALIPFGVYSASHQDAIQYLDDDSSKYAYSSGIQAMFGYPAHKVAVLWVNQNQGIKSPFSNGCDVVVLLGTGDGFSYLWDIESRTSLRVPSSAIVVLDTLDGTTSC